ncbi:hypothetical protein DM01DRAFT_1135034 [Hesseltinella vesiculosa]|uniref:RING-type domain-containing protein n=1 Tax=Hesseltinella vesiculosa TaxID=101127 RepID=A0A1X2G8X2_9FUNG|nr:hypothetical protein DM01DRAFT_1135034 [Hesseltinella vesiculosa]
MHLIRDFCTLQSYLLSRYQWPLLKATKALLLQAMPQEEDYGCPICLSLLEKPMTFQSCRHRFCGRCTEKLFASHLGGVINNSSSLSITSADHGLPCPICRDSVEKEDVVLDQSLANFLKAYFPPCLPWWKKLLKLGKRVLQAILKALSASTMYYPDYADEDDIHRHAVLMVMY